MNPHIADYTQLDIPPAPWHLRGSACVSLWRVPLALLPAPPSGVTYHSVAGQAFVVTAWVNYLPGGTLSYDELALAVLARSSDEFSPACTVPLIWVNDPVSAAGGRRLWGIPKELAEFAAQPSTDGADSTVHASIAGKPLASLTVTRGVALPGKLPLRGFLLQNGPGGLMRTRCAARGQVRLGRVTWDFARSGPLAFLRARKPLFSVLVSDLQGDFGL